MDTPPNEFVLGRGIAPDAATANSLLLHCSELTLA